MSNEFVKLIKPYIDYFEVEDYFKDIFKSAWFTKGKYLKEFKQILKEYIKAKYIFTTSSATTALSLALEIVGVKNKDEVIVADFSFPASVNVIENIGAKPIFCDVSLKTFNMCQKNLEKKITKKTKAIIYVDTFGNPSGVHKIKNIAKKYSIPLIEDAACALGSSEAKVKCGNIADITCFSFHPRKVINTGEGGAISTNNEKYAKSLEIKLNHGAVDINGKLDFISSGYNYRLTEIQAVMGLLQIKKLNYIVKSRNKIRIKYIKTLKSLNFIPQKINKNVKYNVQSLVFITPNNINRDKLIQKLKKNNIESTIGTYSLSSTSYYKNKYNDIQKNSKYLYENTITLPCHEDVNLPMGGGIIKNKIV